MVMGIVHLKKNGSHFQLKKDHYDIIGGREQLHQIILCVWNWKRNWNLWFREKRRYSPIFFSLTKRSSFSCQNLDSLFRNSPKQQPKTLEFCRWSKENMDRVLGMFIETAKLGLKLLLRILSEVISLNSIVWGEFNVSMVKMERWLSFSYEVLLS